MQSFFIVKDKLFLLFVGIICSILAWSFWAYFKDDAFSILNLVFVVALVAQNYSLRKKLRILSKSLPREPGEGNMD